MQSLALLIGSPLGSLSGVGTDLNIMQRVLEAYGFTCTTITHATRALIIKEWDIITDKASQGDAVVFYYTGHGGMAENGDEGDDGKFRRRLQYLVPVDFEETTENDWRGIADVELSRMLRKTTSKTRNVTFILDCCHAARMARLPGTVKAIDPSEYREVSKHVEKMLREGGFSTDFYQERNPDVVTIAASTQTDSAYEQMFNKVQMSVLAEALEKALQRLLIQGAAPTQVSWRTIMHQVRDRMKVTCPQQYPQVEGEDLRFTFSLDKADLHDAIHISVNGDNVVLDGGEIHGLKQNDSYSLLPFREESLDPAKQIAEVVVTSVTPTKSKARFEGISRPTQQHREDGMKAFLKKRQLGRLPVALQGSKSFEKLFDSITNSRFVSVADPDEQLPLATVLQDATQIQLYSHQGNVPYLLDQWQLQGEYARDVEGCVENCFTKLESLARSRHLLTLNPGSKTIAEQIDVELGRFVDSKDEPWSGDILTIVEGEKIYLKITNTGLETVYVSIFDLCADSVILVSDGFPSGRELPQNGTYTFGEDEDTGELVGSLTSWPDEIPRRQVKIPEHLVLIVTNRPIDLRVLETDSRIARGGDDASEFSNLIDSLSSANSRYVSRAGRNKLLFGVRRISFELASKAPEQDVEEEDLEEPSIAGFALPTPESIEKWMSLPAHPPSAAASKGLFGAAVRTIQGIPSCVWVVNEHDEDITVVVSKYRPNRLLAGGELSVSPSGVGVNCSTTTYVGPATKKMLAPRVRNPEASKAAFPLWSRKDGFGVITIFTGSEKTLFIENDRLHVGSTVYFRNQPDLVVVEYGS